MKRRRPEIPDFAPKRPHNQPVDKINPQKTKPVAARPQVIKPQGTSSKSGRRGQ
jgi:hypothetical protein